MKIAPVSFMAAPWTASIDANGYVNVYKMSEPMHLICKVITHYYRVFVPLDRKKNEHVKNEACATAQLICAAPDMYASLHRIKRALLTDPHGLRGACLADINGVLAKAEKMIDISNHPPVTEKNSAYSDLPLE